MKTCGHTGDAAPFHTLDTLIAELATRCRNRCPALADPATPSLPLTTEPAPTQRRATHLIEMFPAPETPKAEYS